jgi:hypothetical protein
VKHQGDYAQIVRELESKGKSLADKSGRNALKRCRKSVPPPPVLVKRLQELGEEVAMKVDPLTNEPLLGHNARRAWEGLLVQAEQSLLSGKSKARVLPCVDRRWGQPALAVPVQWRFDVQGGLQNFMLGR